jgi:hypothetical protein
MSTNWADISNSVTSYITNSSGYYGYFSEVKHIIINQGYMYASYAGSYSDADGNFFNVGGIAKIDMANGNINPAWYVDPNTSNLYKMAVDSTNTYLYVGTVGGNVGSNIAQISLDYSNDGVYNPYWQQNIEFWSGNIAILGTTLYAGAQHPGTYNSYIMCFDTTTGNYNGNIGNGSIDNHNITCLAADSTNNYLYVSLENNYISRIDLATNNVELTWCNTGCATQYITVYDGSLFAINVVGANILQISLSTGTVINSNYGNAIYYPTALAFNDSIMYLYTTQNGYIIKVAVNPLCFHEDTKILTDKGYVVIKDLRKGDLVKTRLSGYKPVVMIGHSKIYNPAHKLHSMNRLYKLSPQNYPELTEDLIITGCHSILVDELTEEQRENTVELMGDVYVTEDTYRLFACFDPKAEPYDYEGVHNIWHFALENENYYRNYGVYANGLLVESTSKRMMKELSGMELIE